MTDAARAQIEAYLRELREHLAGASRELREEICAEIEGHIEADLGDRASDASAVREVLARLGDPREIAAAAGVGEPTPPSHRRVEITAILLLTVGSLLVPVVGWVAGAVFLWVSRRFSLADKVFGTLVIPGGLGGLLIGAGLFLTVSTAAVQGPSWSNVALFLALLAALAGAVYTPIRLVRRVAHMQ